MFLDSNLKEHEQRQKVVELTVNFNASVRPTRLPYCSNLFVPCVMCHVVCLC